MARVCGLLIRRLSWKRSTSTTHFCAASRRFHTAFRETEGVGHHDGPRGRLGRCVLLCCVFCGLVSPQ